MNSYHWVKVLLPGLGTRRRMARVRTCLWREDTLTSCKRSFSLRALARQRQYAVTRAEALTAVSVGAPVSLVSKGYCHLSPNYTVLTYFCINIFIDIIKSIFFIFIQLLKMWPLRTRKPF